MPSSGFSPSWRRRAPVSDTPFGPHQREAPPRRPGESSSHMRLRLVYWGLFWLGAFGLNVATTGAFELTAPRSSAVVTGGQSIPVTVKVEREAGIRKITYYWYRAEEEPLPPQLAEAALVADMSATPPFGGNLTVPLVAAGRMRLLAVAEVTQGRLGTRPDFDEVVVQVEPPAPIETIEFEAEKPWIVQPIGKLTRVPAVGLFQDGLVRSIDSPSAGSQFQSSDPNIARVLDDGWIRVERPGRASLQVVNRGKVGTLDIQAIGDDEPNRPPSANPGEDQTVKGGARVVLSGVQSVDPDGDPLRYEWSQVRGLKVDLTGPNEAKASFIAPKVAAKRLIRFRLQVTDMIGPDTVKGADSLPAYLNIWVEP